MRKLGALLVAAAATAGIVAGGAGTASAITSTDPGAVTATFNGSGGAALTMKLTNRRAHSVQCHVFGVNPSDPYKQPQWTFSMVGAGNATTEKTELVGPGTYDVFWNCEYRFAGGLERWGSDYRFIEDAQPMPRVTVGSSPLGSLGSLGFGSLGS